MSKELYLPAGAIRGLGRYLDRGVTVKLVEEEFKGRTIHRWIANDEIVLYSTEVEQDGLEPKE